MKKSFRILTALFLLGALLLSNAAFAENSSGRRMFVQLDRNSYAPGEALWFSAYLRNTGSGFEEKLDNSIKAELLDSNGKLVSSSTAMAAEAFLGGKIYPGVIFLENDVKPGKYIFQARYGLASDPKSEVLYSQEIDVLAEGVPAEKKDICTINGERELKESENCPIRVKSMSNATFFNLDMKNFEKGSKYALYVSNDFSKSKIADIEGGLEENVVLRIGRNKLTSGVNTASLEDADGKVQASREFHIAPLASEKVSCIPSYTVKPSGRRTASSLEINLKDGNGQAESAFFTIAVLDMEAMKTMKADAMTVKALSSVKKGWRKENKNPGGTYLQNKNASARPVDESINVIDHICNLYSSFFYEGGMMYNRNAGYANRSGMGFQPVALVVNGVQEYSWSILENTTMESVEIADISSSPSGLYRNSGGGYVSIVITSPASIIVQNEQKENLPPKEGPAYEFYSPRYDLEKISSKSDKRNTIFWSPVECIKDGKANVVFWTSDSDAASYYIVINGVTLDGQSFSWHGTL